MTVIDEDIFQKASSQSTYDGHSTGLDKLVTCIAKLLV